MSKKNNIVTMAEEINDHLKNDGVVVVSTYLKSWQYEKKHAGMFFMKDNDLYVKAGKNSNCLSNGKRLLVNIKLYKERSLE